jgi:tripartite ATP-independent transporter DctM subunit
MTIIIGLAALLFFLAIGLPVALALALGGGIGLLVQGGPDLLVGILSTAPSSAISSYELLTIPMFLLMAEFMVVSGISHTLFSAISMWTSRLRGGLGLATAITGAAFGAISGSSTAAAATLSTSSIPSMIRQGYEKKFAAGIVAISGTLAMLIPPSIAIIFYGLLSGENIAKLLIAGIVPGILVTITIFITIWVLIWRNPSLAPKGYRTSWRDKVDSLKVAGPFVILFTLVTGLIYLGVATPVESSAMGALGALMLTVLSGKLDRKSFYRAISRACMTSAMIGLIIVCAQLYGTFLTMTGVTQNLVEYTATAGLNPYTILAILVVMYLVLGCFLDQLSILILTVPVVLPLVKSLDFDGIWFGIIIILLAEIGVVTPPVGLNVFVVSRTTKMPVEEVFHGVWPHVIAHILLVIVLIMLPEIILWLPSRMDSW